MLAHRCRRTAQGSARRAPAAAAAAESRKEGRTSPCCSPARASEARHAKQAGSRPECPTEFVVAAGPPLASVPGSHHAAAQRRRQQQVEQKADRWGECASLPPGNSHRGNRLCPNHAPLSPATLPAPRSMRQSPVPEDRQENGGIMPSAVCGRSDRGERGAGRARDGGSVSEAARSSGARASAVRQRREGTARSAPCRRRKDGNAQQPPSPTTSVIDACRVRRPRPGPQPEDVEGEHACEN